MKLPAARVDAFLGRYLAAPDPELRAFLCYGPDQGLVRERADRLARSIVADPRDPFRLAELTGPGLLADPARLADEAQAQALTGGRRVLRVREAGDAVGALFDRFLRAPGPGDSVFVVEAGELPARSSLRRAFEAAKPAMAIACYADGPGELRTLVREVMARHRITVAGEALEYLVANLGGDRMVSRQELEKLALYVGDGGSLGHDEAAAAVGDGAALALDDIVYAAADGDAAALERSLQRGFEAGEAPVTVLRALMRHFQRLHLSGARCAAGADAAEVGGRLRPPVFYKFKDRFLRQLRLWPPERAADALLLLVAAERNAKRSGPPPEAVCRDALLRIARTAAAAGRR